jgi:hypothetical protein
LTAIAHGKRKNIPDERTPTATSVMLAVIATGLGFQILSAALALFADVRQVIQAAAPSREAYTFPLGIVVIVYHVRFEAAM